MLIRSFFLRTKKRNSQICQQAILFKDYVIKNKPLEIFMDVGSKCNLRCPKCFPQSNMEYFKTVGYGDMLTPDIFKELKPVLRYVIHCLMCGIGEPLVNPYLMDYVDALTSEKVLVSFLTNGLLLDKFKAKEMVDKGVFAIIFSIDAAKKDTYERLQKGSNFERVVENISYLTDYKKEKGKVFPNIRIFFVAGKDNISELPDLIRLMANFNLNAIWVEPLLDNMGETTDFCKEQSLDRIDKGIIEEVILESKRVAEEKYVHLILADYFFRHSHVPEDNGKTISHGNVDLRSYIEENRLICTQPWTSAYVTPNGKVTACPRCTLGEYLGDLLEESLKDIWTGEKYINLRKSLSENQKPPICRYCLNQGKSLDSIKDLISMLNR